MIKWLRSFWNSLTTPMPREPEAAKAGKPAESFRGPAGITNNFTPRAKQVLSLARAEAERFNHNFIGTEHVLLGLIQLGQGTAINVLRNLGVDLEALRSEIELQVGTGPEQRITAPIPYTPRVKKVFTLAVQEARALNHTYVGTEHLFLGLLSEGDGVAARVLNQFDVNLAVARARVLGELNPNAVEAGPSAPEPVRRSLGPTKVDLTRRYDLYCLEGSQVTVYENVLFQAIAFPPENRRAEFFEVQLPNGGKVYVSIKSVIKFLEHRPPPSAAGP